MPINDIKALLYFLPIHMEAYKTAASIVKLKKGREQLLVHNINIKRINYYIYINFG